MIEPRRLRLSRGLTRVEVFVIMGVFALAASVLIPSVLRAREGGRTAHCLANLRQIGVATTRYVNENEGRFPSDLMHELAANDRVFSAFQPTKMILRSGRLSIERFSCPDDSWTGRVFSAGDGTPKDHNSLGLGGAGSVKPGDRVRISYGINEMATVAPENAEERRLYSDRLEAYRQSDWTLMFGDATYLRARGHERVVGDEPRHKARVGNAGAASYLLRPLQMDAEWVRPNPAMQRHGRGSNAAMMDASARFLYQGECFERLKYSWVEAEEGTSGRRQ